jgi:two-component system, NarL family, nitrate/nitrite response regulator NarL
MSFNQAITARAGGAIRVLVVSDVLLYREGIRRGLDRLGRLSIVGASSGAAAAAMLGSIDVDAILLDASASESLLVARQLRASHPDLPIVGFGIGSTATSLACAEAGLIGFVGRDGTLSELERAVEQAIAGEVGCSPKLVAMLCRRVAALSGESAPAAASLTRRERQISALVSEGLSNKEIAIELRIGPATVKNHIHNILEKLQVPRRGAIGTRFRALAAMQAPNHESEAHSAERKTAGQRIGAC